MVAVHKLVASVGWSLASQILMRQSPMRVVLSVATTLVREGVKVKVGTWINAQKLSRRVKLFMGMKLTAKKTIRWAKKKRRKMSQSEVHDSATWDAGMKYKDSAERRLKVARASFEAAAAELKTAEHEMKDAEIYVKSLRPHCEKIEEQNDIDDFILVDHYSQNQGKDIQS